MKKLMILAAVAMTAAVSQAYDIKWGAVQIGIPVATDVKKSQTDITTTTTSSKFGAGDLAVKLYWVSTKGNVYIDEFETTSAGTISAQVLGDKSSDLYAAMVADRGTSWAPQYYATATYTTADGTYTYSGSSTAGKTLANIDSGNIASSMNFNNAGSWSYEPKGTPEPTPEPTSAMLMLLGVAGIALKRKRA